MFGLFQQEAFDVDFGYKKTNWLIKSQLVMGPVFMAPSDISNIS